MRIGFFPSQADAIRTAYAEQRRRLIRRGLFVALGSSIISCVCGVATGRNLIARPVVTNGSREGIHAVALGPTEELRRQAAQVEAALTATPDDPVIGIAFQRLLTMALTQPDDEALTLRLLRFGERPGMPLYVVESVRALRAARCR